MDETRENRLGIASEEARVRIRGWRRIAWPPKPGVVSYGKLGRISMRARGHR